MNLELVFMAMLGLIEGYLFIAIMTSGGIGKFSHHITIYDADKYSYSVNITVLLVLAFTFTIIFLIAILCLQLGIQDNLEQEYRVLLGKTWFGCWLAGMLSYFLIPTIEHFFRYYLFKN